MILLALILLLVVLIIVFLIPKNITGGRRKKKKARRKKKKKKKKKNRGISSVSLPNLVKSIPDPKYDLTTKIDPDSKTKLVENIYRLSSFYLNNSKIYIPNNLTNNDKTSQAFQYKTFKQLKEGIQIIIKDKFTNFKLIFSGLAQYRDNQIINHYVYQIFDKIPINNDLKIMQNIYNINDKSSNQDFIFYHIRLYRIKEIKKELEEEPEEEPKEEPEEKPKKDSEEKPKEDPEEEPKEEPEEEPEIYRAVCLAAKVINYGYYIYNIKDTEWFFEADTIENLIKQINDVYHFKDINYKIKINDKKIEYYFIKLDIPYSCDVIRITHFENFPKYQFILEQITYYI
jgi:hypothetical protein